ncbi:conjugal transfer protein TraD [Pseudoroseomonas wenyumeiae]
MARTEAVAARADTRDWAATRRARTRQLIELGGLVHKAGLVELVDDDRATLLGALLELAGRLRDGEVHGDAEPVPADHLRARWRHTGLRAFHAEREAMREAAEAGQAQVRGAEVEAGLA